jgi:RNA polymerase sigma-70 factor (ECF subfamily)
MLRLTEGALLTAVPLPARDLLWSPGRRARLVRLCAAFTGDSSAAEDLAQETLLEAWRLQARLTDLSGAEAWLNAIARNVCRRWLRAQGASAWPTGDDAVLEGASEARDLDSVLEREELVELLDRALGLLPEGTRAALVGHYVDELSHAELAERLGTSADAVSMRVSRGRSRLRYLLETEFAEDTVAEGWSRRDDAGWRSTRLTCPDCGAGTMVMRHSAAEVAFRCLTCEPAGLSVQLPLDAPAFGALVGDVRRPSAIRSRVTDWARSYWLADGTAPVPRPCVRCGREVTPHTYDREDDSAWWSRHGWYAECDGCGQQVSSSVAGLALALPEVRDARRLESRLRLLPARDVEREGQPAKVVEVATRQGRPVVGAVFLTESLRLVHVD